MLSGDVEMNPGPGTGEECSGVARICLVVGHKMGALARPRKI